MMRYRVRLASLSLLFGLAALALAADLPAPWKAQDVGNVNTKGSAEVKDGKWTIKASGDDIWGTADAFHYLSQPVSGDATAVCRVVSIENTNEWAKAGIMFRTSTKAESRYAFMCVTPGSGADFQYRESDGAEAANASPQEANAPYWVKVQRKGDVFTAFVSKDGKDWTKFGETTIQMGKDVQVGVAVTSHNNDAVTTAVVENVEVTKG